MMVFWSTEEFCSALYISSPKSSILNKLIIREIRNRSYNSCNIVIECSPYPSVYKKGNARDSVSWTQFQDHSYKEDLICLENYAEICVLSSG